MKQLCVGIAILAMCVSCKKDGPPAATPAPNTTQAVAPAAPAASSGSAGCVITVAMAPAQVSYDGGGVHGKVPLDPSRPPDLSALRPLADTCAAFVTAADALKYQDVISVMDELTKQGIVDISLDKPGAPAAAPPKAPPAPPPADFAPVWSKDANGNPVLEAKVTPTNNASLKNAPVIVVTKTQVLYQGKQVTTPDDREIGKKITAVLPQAPTDPTVILQADAGTSAAVINRLVAATSSAGYTNLLFAVKSK